MLGDSKSLTRPYSSDKADMGTHFYSQCMIPGRCLDNQRRHQKHFETQRKTASGRHGAPNWWLRARYCWRTIKSTVDERADKRPKYGLQICDIIISCALDQTSESIGRILTSTVRRGAGRRRTNLETRTPDTQHAREGKSVEKTQWIAFILRTRSRGHWQTSRMSMTTATDKSIFRKRFRDKKW